MQHSRPAPSVQQGPGCDNRPARYVSDQLVDHNILRMVGRSSTSSTSAAGRRTNSYLETFGAHNHVDSHDLTASKSRALSYSSKALQIPTGEPNGRNGETGSDPERQPLLSTGGPHDQEHRAVSGESTLLQTVLNSMNSLLGVGLLSLPLGLLCSGWIIGSILLLVFAVLTSYTATLLADCMKVDSSCKSYSDIAGRTYGPRCRLATVFLFGLITITACVAQVILFADSMNALLPVLSVLQWKLVCGLLLLPLHFAPFRVLSIASILGIATCAMTVLIIIYTGLTTNSQPGSLLHPVKTTLLPMDWSKMPLSLGLLMSPWTAHAILPNLYADMSKPAQFRKAVSITFSLTYVIDMALATCGYLMYGELTTDEITYNVISASHSRALAISLTVLVAIMPITKIPLMSRPLVIMTEYALGLIKDQPAHEELPPDSTHNDTLYHVYRCAMRVLCVLLLSFAAAVAPDFRIVMAFMGSAMCYTIAIILPILFYIKTFGGKLALTERMTLWVLLYVSSVTALIGTVWALAGEQIAARLT